MRLLFALDNQDYEECTRTFRRDSARSIVIRDGKVAMLHSLTHDHYEFPGGGIESGESPVEAMIRETREEAGLVVIPESVREYGSVHRIQRSEFDASECFVQDNYYYLCEAMEQPTSPQPEAYEAQEAYRLEFVEARTALEKNRDAMKRASRLMLQREVRMLETLLAEGLLP